MGKNIDFDVVVVGAGNAALCAALSASEAGATVIVLEKSPKHSQGGNCPYTGAGFRFTHSGIKDLKSLLPENTATGEFQMAPYTDQDFRDHFMEATHGDTDKELVEVVISKSRETINWMHSNGVRWELPVNINLENVPSIIPNQVGLSAYESGPGLVKMLTKAVESKSISILYETKMVSIHKGGRGQIESIQVQDRDGINNIRCKAVVLACGGFEANPEMRIKYLGTKWETAKVRGSKYNTGDGHRVALNIGAATYGQWTGCHGTPIDLNAPRTGDLALTDAMPRRSYNLGIMVNLDGNRFTDEGVGFAEQTFVQIGSEILSQKRNMAFQIFDQRAVKHLEDRYGGSRCKNAKSIWELASLVGINPAVLKATVDKFNEEAEDADYHPGTLDGRSTLSVYPAKSNWAIKIDKPPFIAYPVTGSITYTYGGLKIDKNARVLDLEDNAIPGLYAAGEIVGGIFYHNSLRAAGLMHGSVFGKLAGQHAGRL
ncbi:MAG: FAD-dependent oxidoreductase [SAR202 cluster bacterium]|nr:FAD-dependent oxidoreductase [SAR202 cluster bacterium]|tara:strand:+ start:149330 stop:150790 length:1461 start_codon:yes stop_codon:yes gene_type:complete